MANRHRHSFSLEAATLEKIRQYEELLKCKSAAEANVQFWDVVVLTAGDEDQRVSFQQQVDLKQQRGEIPRWVRYLVFFDPPGPKIGNGGATMHALEELQKAMPAEELEKAKVLLLHAGGYSQRLPIVSVPGKVFMALPCGNPMFQMLEALLWMFIDFPARMNPGVYLTASDIIFLYNGAGEWTLTEPGFTAIGHPSSLEIARTHGVYVPQDMDGTREKYLKDPSKPTVMATAKQFLHKLPADKLREKGAIIPGTDEVYVDLAYYMDYDAVKKLTKFYKEHKPLTCEIDAYGDFLQALGPGATDEYCNNVVNVSLVTSELVEMRKKVYQLLKGTAMNVVIFHEAQFNHMGTTEEYLYHMCSNETLARACGLTVETMVRHVEGDSGLENNGHPEVKKARRSNRVVMHSVLEGGADCTTIHEGSVVEYCTLEEGVEIGKNCIVSNLHIPASAKIPDSSFLHTVAVEADGEIQYATFAFDTNDSMKTSKPREKALELNYCQLTMEAALPRLGYAKDLSIVWPKEVSACSLWNARLFPVFSSRRASSEYAISMIRLLKGLQKAPEGSSEPSLLSMNDMLRMKSITALLAYHTELRKTILLD